MMPFLTAANVWNFYAEGSGQIKLMLLFLHQNLADLFHGQIQQGVARYRIECAWQDGTCRGRTELRSEEAAPVFVCHHFTGTARMCVNQQSGTPSERGPPAGPLGVLNPDWLGTSLAADR
jgi:hypothetical protein